MEQSTVQFAGRICERCLMRKLQCHVQAGMWTCTQCKRSKARCVFGIARASETEVEDKTSYLTPESTPNSHPTIPHYGTLGGNGTQQVSGLPTESGAWDWVGYGIVDVHCSPNWQFHMTSHSFDHDTRLCGLMAAKVNFVVQQALGLSAPYKSWDWIAEGTALEVSKSSTCSPDWNFHIQDFGGHNSLLCGWMAAKLNSLVRPRVQPRCYEIGMDSGAGEVQETTLAS